MPLRRGYSKEAIGANISEIIRSWRKTGRIGESKPGTLTKARDQAIAIAYAKARQATSGKEEIYRSLLAEKRK